MAVEGVLKGQREDVNGKPSGLIGSKSQQRRIDIINRNLGIVLVGDLGKGRSSEEYPKKKAKQDT